MDVSNAKHSKNKQTFYQDKLSRREIAKRLRLKNAPKILEVEKGSLTHCSAHFSYRANFVYVNSLSLVVYQGYKYSKPCEFSGKEVTLQVFAQHIKIVYQGQCIAVYMHVAFLKPPLLITRGIIWGRLSLNLSHDAMEALLDASSIPHREKENRMSRLGSKSIMISSRILESIALVRGLSRLH